MIYDGPLPQDSESEMQPTLMATSHASNDGAAVGAGNFTRTFFFEPDANSPLDPTKEYFAYFDEVVTARYMINGIYQGGSAYVENREEKESWTLQFLIEMEA